MSRHNPRKHVVIQGRIGSVSTYDTYYDLAIDALTRNRMPIVFTEPGHIFLRWARAKHTPNINAARTVPPADFSSMDKDNRFSGIRLDGKPGQGAIYTASITGSLREFTHYQQTNKERMVLPGKMDQTRQFMRNQVSTANTSDILFHIYRGLRRTFFADMRLSSANVQRLFAEVARSPSARNIYGMSSNVTGESLVRAFIDAKDTSASRGFADAVADYRGHLALDGVVADSARSDSDMGLVTAEFGPDVAGTNYIFFGSPGQVHQCLVPVDTFTSLKDMRDKLLA